ncbi:ABC transporter permease [Deinococcus radiopugnans]|uniref:ABC transporter permease n=1 Tax=Deinococcus radiopugnans ATCC 19172 TaxID=585398 RepID=A0A5C4YBV5_9DEIO|nr:ABC transporter permease [Deinococcus radiopugnans]MBB6015181.1 peptide/nickel transport system permease protein [Deinococcus radiopugnans ATCC 19172]TNM73111.1 ABC transporter permease [Deinococcus radiopugnans ATCC 19172]
MLPFIAKRGLQGVVLLIMVSFISFVVMNLAPGNAMQTFINPRMSPQEITRAENALGINKPIPVQYLSWASNLLQGNFGYSVRNGESVTALLKQRAGPTLLLTATSFLLIVCIALVIGVYSAARPYSLIDYLSTTLVFAGISIPSFFFGLTLIYLFSVQLGWFPTSGFESYSADHQGLELFLDRVWHMALPVCVLTLTGIAGILRHVRSSVSEALRQDYIRTARSKGVGERAILVKHALRNGLIPVVTLLGLSLPAFFAGSVITETIFAWPGMGRLLVDSVFARDYPVSMAINTITAVLVIVGSLVADVLYGLIDPRVRFDG